MGDKAKADSSKVIEVDLDKNPKVPKDKKGLVKRLSKTKEVDPKKQQEKQNKATENYEAQIQSKKDKASKTIEKAKEAQDRAKTEEAKADKAKADSSKVIEIDLDKNPKVPKDKKGLVKRLSKTKEVDPKKQQEKQNKATENYEAQIQ